MGSGASTDQKKCKHTVRFRDEVAFVKKKNITDDDTFDSYDAQADWSNTRDMSSTSLGEEIRYRAQNVDSPRLFGLLRTDSAGRRVALEFVTKEVYDEWQRSKLKLAKRKRTAPKSYYAQFFSERRPLQVTAAPDADDDWSLTRELRPRVPRPVMSKDLWQDEEESAPVSPFDDTRSDSTLDKSVSINLPSSVDDSQCSPKTSPRRAPSYKRVIKTKLPNRIQLVEEVKDTSQDVVKKKLARYERPWLRFANKAQIMRIRRKRRRQTGHFGPLQDRDQPHKVEQTGNNFFLTQSEEILESCLAEYPDAKREELKRERSCLKLREFNGSSGAAIKEAPRKSPMSATDDNEITEKQDKEIRPTESTPSGKCRSEQVMEIIHEYLGMDSKGVFRSTTSQSMRNSDLHTNTECPAPEKMVSASELGADKIAYHLPKQNSPPTNKDEQIKEGIHVKGEETTTNCGDKSQSEEDTLKHNKESPPRENPGQHVESPIQEDDSLSKEENMAEKKSPGNTMPSGLVETRVNIDSTSARRIADSSAVISLHGNTDSPTVTATTATKESSGNSDSPSTVAFPKNADSQTVEANSGNEPASQVTASRENADSQTASAMNDLTDSSATNEERANWMRPRSNNDKRQPRIVDAENDDSSSSVVKEGKPGEEDDNQTEEKRKRRDNRESSEGRIVSKQHTDSVIRVADIDHSSIAPVETPSRILTANKRQMRDDADLRQKKSITPRTTNKAKKQMRILVQEVAPSVNKDKRFQRHLEATR